MTNMITTTEAERRALQSFTTQQYKRTHTTHVGHILHRLAQCTAFHLHKMYLKKTHECKVR